MRNGARADEILRLLVPADSAGNYVQQNVQHREGSAWLASWEPYDNFAGWRRFTRSPVNLTFQFFLICQWLSRRNGKIGKSRGGGMNLRFTGGRESDSL